jgi:hypothetical protein
MTARALPRSRLGNLIPSLVESQALVALVPATGDLKWATGAAWDVARAAAQHGRRVALVDLWIEDPKLHEVVGLAPSEGIVDAFEYGVSLTKATHEIDRVFFIPAGSCTAHAGELFGHERWKKLHGGFRHEGALLLLFLSAGAVARLGTIPDGLLVLSPDGFEPQSSIGQGIAAALERGIPLLGVVRERWTPAAGAAPVVAAGSRPARPAAHARHRARPLVVAATLAAGAAGTWGLWTRGGEPRSTAAATPAPVEQPRPARPKPVDSLFWTVQLAAYGTLDKALVLADRVAAEGVPAFVTPVALEGRRGAVVWYRVLAGAFANRDSAAAALAALWKRGTATKGQGDVLRAPYSFALRDGGHPDSLRARGIPTVRWSAEGALLVGAFETPEQAALTETHLKRAGLQASLVTRLGTRP